MQKVASAQTKLILLGEHAAVYGYSAIGLALPQKITVTISPSDRMEWKNAPSDKRLDALLKALPQWFSIKETIAVDVCSEVPIGAGFGSSAALSVALVRALGEANSRDRSYEWKTAHELEKMFHSTPSGIDTGISVFESCCAFKGGGPGIPQCNPLKIGPLYLIVGAVPRTSNTYQLVSCLRKKQEGDQNLADILKKLGSNAEKAIALLEAADAEGFGNIATESHQLLQTLGLSTPELDSMISYGISQGALGGKLSGAGGGGAYYLVTKDQQQAETIAKACYNYAQEKQTRHLLFPTPLAHR